MKKLTCLLQLFLGCATLTFAQPAYECHQDGKVIFKYDNPNGQGTDGNELPKWLPYTKEGRDGMSFQAQGATPQHGETEFMRFLIEKKIEETCK